jgi:hypothetical protein
VLPSPAGSSRATGAGLGLASAAPRGLSGCPFARAPAAAAGATTTVPCPVVHLDRSCKAGVLLRSGESTPAVSRWSCVASASQGGPSGWIPRPDVHLQCNSNAGVLPRLAESNPATGRQLCGASAGHGYQRCPLSPANYQLTPAGSVGGCYKTEGPTVLRGLQVGARLFVRRGGQIRSRGLRSGLAGLLVAGRLHLWL